MPLYEYQCQDCGVRFERRQHINDEPIKICPECEGEVRRLIQPVGVIFKGSGFYVTDNRASLPPPNQGASKSQKPLKRAHLPAPRLARAILKAAQRANSQVYTDKRVWLQQPRPYFCGTREILFPPQPAIWKKNPSHVRTIKAD